MSARLELRGLAGGHGRTEAFSDLFDVFRRC